MYDKIKALFYIILIKIISDLYYDCTGDRTFQDFMSYYNRSDLKEEWLRFKQNQ